MRVAVLAALLLATTSSAATGDVPLAWSPDGKRILVGSCAGGCAIKGIVSRSGGSLHPVRAFSVEWSADGRRTALATKRGPAVGDADGQHVRLIGAGGAWPAWAPDGRRLAFVNKDETGIVVVDVDSGDSRTYLHSPACPSEHCVLELYDPTWSPDGKRISVEVVGPYETHGDPLKNPPSFMRLLDVESGDWSALISDRGPSCFGQSEASWSPDGKWLAYYALDCDEIEPPLIAVVEVGGKRVRWLPGRGTHAWAPAGHTLAYTARRNRKPVVFVFDVEQPRASAAYPGRDFAWSPDGKRLALVHDGAIWIGARKIARGSDPRWIGRFLAYAAGRCVHVRDVRTRRDARVTRPC